MRQIHLGLILTFERAVFYVSNHADNFAIALSRASDFSSSAFKSGVSLISRRYVSSGDCTEGPRGRRGRVMRLFQGK